VLATSVLVMDTMNRTVWTPNKKATSKPAFPILRITPAERVSRTLVTKSPKHMRVPRQTRRVHLSAWTSLMSRDSGLRKTIPAKA